LIMGKQVDLFPVRIVNIFERTCENANNWSCDYYPEINLLNLIYWEFDVCEFL